MDQDTFIKNPSWVLRPATISDYDSIAAVWHASASQSGVSLKEMPTAHELRRRIDAEMKSGWQVTVADQGGEVVGFAAIKRDTSVLDQLFVRPDFFGGGFGRALLEHCIVAMPKGFTLRTAKSNSRACAFYLNAGLSFLGHDSHPRTGHPVSYFGWKPSKECTIAKQNRDSAK
ncbi:MAG: GNAT family N-acetyltransferase [Hyphomonadaceae bacterium]